LLETKLESSKTITFITMSNRFRRVYAQRCSKQVKQLLDQANDYIASSSTKLFPKRSK